MLLKVIGQLFGYDAVRCTSCLDISKLLLSLALELRVLDLDGDDRSETLTDIFTGKGSDRCPSGSYSYVHNH